MATNVLVMGREAALRAAALYCGIGAMNFGQDDNP